MEVLLENEWINVEGSMREVFDVNLKGWEILISLIQKIIEIESELDFRVWILKRHLY